MVGIKRNIDETLEIFLTLKECDKILNESNLVTKFENKHYEISKSEDSSIILLKTINKNYNLFEIPIEIIKKIKDKPNEPHGSYYYIDDKIPKLVIYLIVIK